MNTKDYKYPKEQIIIVGAGIAGLSLAIQLTENNIPCLVLEARDHFSGATSGVRISANGVKVLEKMGIHHIGEPTEKLIMYFGNNKISFNVNKKPNESAAIIVTRLAIFEKLRQRVEEMDIQILYDFTLDHVIEHETGVIAISSNGKHIEGKYLVGADGVGSKVRSLLNPDSKSNKRYAGYLGIGLIYPSDQKIEMSLFNNVNGNIGLGSIGRIHPNDNYTNNFL
ncbi:FAD-dependent oxidoreductase [Sphingobacteruim zhuxiongii]|nr:MULTISPECIES: NAD(P)/FAD-dependent oxidoreductase [unclassified Sphingobacterium]